MTDSGHAGQHLARERFQVRRRQTRPRSAWAAPWTWRIVRELFARVIEASETLNVDSPLRDELKGKLRAALALSHQRQGAIAGMARRFCRAGSQTPPPVAPVLPAPEQPDFARKLTRTVPRGDAFARHQGRPNDRLVDGLADQSLGPAARRRPRLSHRAEPVPARRDDRHEDDPRRRPVHRTCSTPIRRSRSTATSATRPASREMLVQSHAGVLQLLPRPALGLAQRQSDGPQEPAAGLKSIWNGRTASSCRREDSLGPAAATAVLRTPDTVAVQGAETKPAAGANPNRFLPRSRPARRSSAGADLPELRSAKDDNHRLLVRSRQDVRYRPGEGLVEVRGAN